MEKVPLCYLGTGELDKLHEMHYMAVDRTIYLVGKVNTLVKMEEVKTCIKYQSIDLTLSIHEPGEIEIMINWTRFVVDIIHYHESAYLSMIYCGSG